MIKKEQEDYHREDRDLLIELKTRMEGLESQIKDLNNNIVNRVTALENGKLDRGEATRMLTDAIEIHNGYEVRIRSVEKSISETMVSFRVWGTVAVVGLGILQFLIPVGVSIYFN